MKREVWIQDCEESDGRNNNAVIVIGDRNVPVRLKKVEIHESRWIPVSESFPTVAEHYLVVRLDRLDWCYFELVSMDFKTPIGRFTSKGVTHWLEAPPFPVEDEFVQWYSRNLEDIKYADRMELAKASWNAAKESK